MKQGITIIKGQDQDGNEIDRQYIHSELVSISTNILKLKNEKATEYRIGTIKVITAQGELKTVSSMIWESVVDRLTIGDDYLTEVKVVDGNVYLTTSPLNAADRISLEDIAFASEMVKTNIPPVHVPAPTSADLVP